MTDTKFRNLDNWKTTQIELILSILILSILEYIIFIDIVQFMSFCFIYKSIKVIFNSFRYEWVGWKNDSAVDTPPVEVIFEFDKMRNFTEVRIHCNNMFTKDVRVFKHAKIFFR